MLAKYDTCSLYLWPQSDIELLTNNDDHLSQSEKNILELSRKTGSSLKFRLLYPNSRVWFVLFGGGASVCYFDKWMKIVSNTKRDDLMPANYGEMSGNPSRDLVLQYMTNIFDLISASNANGPFYLIIGGGIANFTLVDVTLSGIVDAMTKYHDVLTNKNIQIYVRRGGPNYQAGLEYLSNYCQNNNLTCYVYGPSTSMTSILDMINLAETGCRETTHVYTTDNIDDTIIINPRISPFYNFRDDTTCFIYGAQVDVAQNMLDFDDHTGRSKPSVVYLVILVVQKLLMPVFFEK